MDLKWVLLWVSFLLDFTAAIHKMSVDEIKRLAADNPKPTLDLLITIVKDEKYWELRWQGLDDARAHPTPPIPPMKINVSKQPEAGPSGPTEPEDTASKVPKDFTKCNNDRKQRKEARKVAEQYLSISTSWKGKGRATNPGEQEAPQDDDDLFSPRGDVSVAAGGKF
ncbi:hypothetical protein OBBRIDRAFT_840279 [Obba rivulosa]|uniref:Uncharacterized protein n=1 Tax=Obba rivulosa TaxID=1052685 RepID=A0A8E2AFU7_9APHY|nr:hypothetical protein OBBRIDRAFT_840279 [Obba rivulosa]